MFARSLFVIILMTFPRRYFTDLTSISNADPAVFTLVDHGLYEGDKIRLETTGTLPAGLVLLTDYYVVYNGLGTSVFQVATRVDGVPIATTAAGSGTHSFIKRNTGLSPRYENNR